MQKSTTSDDLFKVIDTGNVLLLSTLRDSIAESLQMFRLTNYRMPIVTFALERTVYPQYITLQTEGRQTTYGRNVTL